MPEHLFLWLPVLPQPFLPEKHKHKYYKLILLATALRGVVLLLPLCMLVWGGCWYRVAAIFSSTEGNLDVSMEVFLSDTLLALLPSLWAPVNLRAGQRIRLEGWSGRAATEAGEFDGMKFWKSVAQAPAQSRTTLVQVCWGFACLSTESIQVWNLSGQYSPLCLHSPAWASQACPPCNYPFR